ncbi:MAG: amidohydrolase [Kutzneria sp.]|nr:amidohydrolase [Kutzneria sp.]
MRIALAQVDCVLGEVDGNIERARDWIDDAVDQHADLIVFPELNLHGYSLGMLEKDSSIRSTDPMITGLCRPEIDVLVGFHEDGGVRAYNSAAYLGADGLVHTHRKLYLPNYLVWEERKYCSPGQAMRAYDTRFGRMATLICNDAWQSVLPWLAAQDGAEVLLVPTNSATGFGPESLNTVEYWEQLLSFTARMQQCWVVFVNRVGVERGARFWGGSRVIDPSGQVVAIAPMDDPALVLADIDVSASRRRRRQVPLVAEARLALIARELDRMIRDGGDG